MRVLFDIGHPGHVHLFKHPRRILLERGHEVFCVSRKKEVTHQLLNAYDIEYVPGTKKRDGWKRGIELVEWSRIVRREIKRCGIDIVASIGSPAGAWAAKISGIPHLAFNDTETSTEQRALYSPASLRIFTPESLLADFGPKQVRYEGTHDLAYLRPEQFTPDDSVREEMGLGPDESYVLLRFVSWDATHDWGKGREDKSFQQRLYEFAAERHRVFITAEGSLPPQIESARLKIRPHRLHDAIAFASAVIGDGTTTLTESAALGVPSLLISVFADALGVIHFFRERELLEAVKSKEQGLEAARRLLETGPTEERSARRQAMLSETIDVAEFIADRCEEFGTH
jgi:predicted glycosyltransferase